MSLAGAPARRALARCLATALNAAGLALLLASAAQADSGRWCGGGGAASAEQQSRLLQLTARVREQLQSDGSPVALVARAGLDLRRFGQIYSHAGLSLRDSPNTPWSVRQLYFACDESRPRLFDEGLAGFVLGAAPGATPADEQHRVWVVQLPPAAAAELAAVALDTPRALALLHPRYSANAHAFEVLYQNCNQWVAELFATTWGGGPAPAAPNRAQAQAWLRAEGYQPTVMRAGPWRGLSLLMPHLNEDDHPEADRAQGLYRVSMPASLADWLHRRWPEARRTEFCLRGQTLLVRQGWQPLDEDCRPAPGDRLSQLD